MRLLPRLGCAIAALALVLGSAGPTRGALLWTLTASPLTVSTGTQTTFSLRASLTLLGDIRCVEVAVPDSFTVHGAAVVGSNAGNSWVRDVSGNDVRVRATSGGDRLRSIGHFVDFTITATAWSAGSLTWASHSHADEDCEGSGSLVSVPPIVLVTGPPATPTPAPTVAPTPMPTPVPTPVPTPIATPTASPRPPATTAPAAQPSATPRTTPPPSAAEATPSAVSTDARPSASPTASPPPSVVAAPDPRDDAGPSPPARGLGGTTGPTGSFDGRLGVEPPLDRGGVDPAAVPIALGALGLLGSIDIRIVPGLLLGVPGLLVVGFVLLQAIGVLAWIPAIRRLRGQEALAAP